MTWEEGRRGDILPTCGMWLSVYCWGQSIYENDFYNGLKQRSLFLVCVVHLPLLISVRDIWLEGRGIGIR